VCGWADGKAFGNLGIGHYFYKAINQNGKEHPPSGNNNKTGGPQNKLYVKINKELKNESRERTHTHRRTQAHAGGCADTEEEEERWNTQKRGVKMRSEEIDFFNTSALAHTHTRGPSAHTHSLLLLHTHTNALEISQKFMQNFPAHCILHLPLQSPCAFPLLTLFILVNRCAWKLAICLHTSRVFPVFPLRLFFFNLASHSKTSRSRTSRPVAQGDFGFALSTPITLYVEKYQIPF